MTRIILAICVVTSIFLSIACVQKGGDGNTAGVSSDTIKVGVYGDLTGQTASFGQSTKNGIQLAVDEINAAGGINGKKIELIVEDDQGQPQQATTVVQKLINQNKVHALLGEVASTNSLAAAPVAQSARIPMITPSSTNPKVTEVGDYISRVCFIDPFQGATMAKFAATTLKAKTAAILGDVNSDYSKGLTQYFEQEFTKNGGTIVTKEAYTQTDPDFKGQLTKIRNLNPDVIYIPGYYSQVGIIARQARELGMNMPLLGGDGWDSPEIWKLGGEALKNSYISNHYSADNPAPEIQNFVKAYQAKFNTVPDSLAALAYDAAKVLADAIKRAGGAEDSAKLKDAINATKNFAGVTGTITLDASRNAVKPAVVLELSPAQSKFTFKETIYPEGMSAPTASPTVADSNANAATNANTMSNANAANGANTNANANSAANSAAANNTNK
ncbi:MAG: Branched-chain amino acid transporter, amino acid-binding protein [Acidobacteria bacterium]|jgi:branched-chain amino acid transport system substrate-binding protein|nr:Branched-chain amino acid transporter, amino acid-binding protein [Acidobacteriota bacterium]